MTQSSLGLKAKQQLIDRFLGKKVGADGTAPQTAATRSLYRAKVPEAFTRFDRHPGYEKMLVPKAMADRLGLRNPFFIPHDGVAGAITCINEREFINFSSYNYLGLAGHPAVNKAAKDAIDRYGTSASASRLVAGERPIQRELEEALAELYEVEDCVVFVSGHATNVSTIGYLFGPKDLVIHDSLIHNSVLEGIKLAGSTRRSFPHNDTQVLDAILAEIRHQFERVLIVVEGHYSMDGDIPDLPALIDIKRRHGCFLMVDEAHALGVLGAKGKGCHEHFDVAGKDVDIWMGTLSKTLAGCGGYIAGERAMVEHLKYAAPGFVYSVGIAPPLAAASLAALRIMLNEPERVARLQENGQLFLKMAKESGVDVGTSQGFAIVPAITGSSLKAAKLSNRLFDSAINVQPIVYPAVEEKAARLRFFISTMHSEKHFGYVCESIRRSL
ncbi:aminotransferase class I/II-fold pyridoxal phosphate-dependent enzyme [Laribacter hongkongensis]|uniref:Putative 8-amino-7-oxononanoate synthase n=1 Tax=Laribacter hongkongensis TaxID=168471 RepID=A0ABD4STY7_9NEIS|nr:aminotransferase class I/II-fold pyridoxal phosphate-dependent enzyme [Laribacter hongkongensis]MCG9026696.1 aminotransferase class I/II-fold pyridoxal phosphate-dependent enzyme [Laribacter hongkongensis]MCG9116354.1 aminotransferase class I/II-fold pyridoxal phosphate-dependent enzyme [Laribacter hongkongensis]